MAESQSVVVTGATGGVGARIVDRLRREGWRVFAAARRPRAIGSDGVVGVQLDLENSDSMAAATETITGQLGSHGLDALINCAGVLVDGPVELIPDDELRRAFEVNVIGPTSLTRRLLPSLRAAGSSISAPSPLKLRRRSLARPAHPSPLWRRSTTRCGWSALSLASKLS
jgi:NAD(P)-dependent dehydrogenase (short-subunit alcohol dehydrogenase family)